MVYRRCSCTRRPSVGSGGSQDKGCVARAYEPGPVTAGSATISWRPALQGSPCNATPGAAPV